MDLYNEHKINSLLRNWPTNAVYLTSWLTEKGYSSQLLNRYKKSNWIRSLGSGAIVKSGDKANLEGSLFAIQKQGGAKYSPRRENSLGSIRQSPLFRNFFATIYPIGFQ